MTTPRLRWGISCGAILCVMVASVRLVHAKHDVIEASEDKHVVSNDTREPLLDLTTCGPAAVGLTLRLYGRTATLDEIGSETWIDEARRTTVASLSSALSKRGIYARGRRLTLTERKQQRHPAIVLAHGPDGPQGEHHFLIYTGTEGDRVRLIDPLGFVPLKQIPEPTFREEWTGVAIVTQPTPFIEYAARRSLLWNTFVAASVGLLLATVAFVCLRVLDAGRSSPRDPRSYHRSLLPAMLGVVVICGIVATVLTRSHVASSDAPAEGLPEQGTSSAQIVFEATRRDLGDRYPSIEQFVATFPFRNTGNMGIALEVEGCCGAYASFAEDKETYAPGEDGEVIVRMNTPAPELGSEVIRHVTVLDREDHRPIAKLAVRVNMKRHWRARPLRLDFGRIAPGQTARATLMIEPGTEEEAGGISGYHLSSPLLDIEKVGEKLVGDQRTHRYVVSVRGGEDPCHLDASIIFQTTNAQSPELVVPATAEFPGLIQVSPRRVYFGRQAPGSTISRKIAISSTCGELLELSEANSEGSFIVVAHDETSSESSTASLELTLDLPTDCPEGILRGNVSVHCTTSRSFEIHVPWIVLITGSRTQDSVEATASL